MDDESPRSLDSLCLDANKFESDENKSETDENMTISAKLESDAAKLGFQEIVESLDCQEMKILDLEKRRQLLQLDMERLQKDIELEKQQFNEAIDFEIVKNNDDMSTCSESSKIDIFNFDKDDITTQLDDFRHHLEQSKEQNVSNREDDDSDIQRFKSNLLNYKKGLDIPEKDKITKDKRKESAKLFQKHLEQVQQECTEKIDELQAIQDNIGHFITEDEHRQL